MKKNELKQVYPSAKIIKLNQIVQRTVKKIKKPFYIANFLFSLDGRISIYFPKKNINLTPKSICTEKDYLFFKTIKESADCLVTHTNYFINYEKKIYGNIIDQDNKPHIILLSNSLNFKISKKVVSLKNRLTVITTCKKQSKIKKLRDQGFKVLVENNKKNVSAKYMDKYINNMGFKIVYFIAGPKIVEDMINKGLLDTLFCTMSINIVGNNIFDTFIRGDILRRDISPFLKNIFLSDEGKGKKIKQVFYKFNFGK